MLKISLTNNDNRPVALVAPALSLGNFSSPSAGYSQRVHVNATGLKASCSAGLGNNPRGRLACRSTDNFQSKFLVQHAVFRV